jgi:hypothetical protein
MRKIISHIFCVFCLILVTGCGLSEDCFKGNGTPKIQTFPLENFTKIKVYEGIGLVIKEGPIYEVKVKTADNILDNLEVKLERDMLVIKDNSTCNLVRDYGQTVVYVTTPLLEEIHSKTEQEIISDGVLTFPELRLYSLDINDGAGTGDFILTMNNLYVLVESNSASNFFISGQTNYLDVLFTWGNGRFIANELRVNNIVYLFHRGSNDMIFKTPSVFNGKLFSTGNLLLKEAPQEMNVQQLFTGRVILNY